MGEAFCTLVVVRAFLKRYSDLTNVSLVCHAQAGVMRGQIYNLINALKDRRSPWELVQMPLCTISRSGKFKYQVRITRTS